MLAMLSTLTILIAASFAAIALGMTLRNSWDLIVQALSYQAPAAKRAAFQNRSAGRRPVAVTVRASASMLSAAA